MSGGTHAKQPWSLRRVFDTAVGAALFLSITGTAATGLIGGLMLATTTVEKHEHEVVYGIRIPTGHVIPTLHFEPETTLEEIERDERNVGFAFAASAGVLLLSGGIFRLTNRKKPETPAQAPAPQGEPPTPPAP